MIEYSKDNLVSALKAIGLKAGDIVLISTELFTLGKLTGAKSKEEHAQMILDAIFEVITDKGTVAVNAFTTYTARYGQPFDYNHSKPITGSFCEYVTFHPRSVRSMHPINSVAAIGHQAKDICLNASASNYGWDSPYERMLRLKAQVLRLGIDYTHNTFLHVIEALYGVPYLYNKIIDAEVIVDGKKSNKQFLASVRYLDFELNYCMDKVKEAIHRAQCVHSCVLGAGFIHRVDTNEYCHQLVKLLRKDPYVFLKESPAFVKGKIPWDGITAGRDGVTQSADYNFETAKQTFKK